MMELHTANDLNNMVLSPYNGFEPVRPPSPEVVKGILVGAKSNTDSMGIEDSRDEWDKEEVSVWSCCPSPTTKLGPTWARGARRCTGAKCARQTKHNLGGHCQ